MKCLSLIWFTTSFYRWISFVNYIFISNLGWFTFFSGINCTLFTRAMVSWIGFYRMLWCNYIETISSFNWISNEKSSSYIVAWCGFTQVFVINDICCFMLFVSIYSVIDRSNTNSCIRWLTRSSNEYMSTNEMGVCYTN